MEPKANDTGVVVSPCDPTVCVPIANALFAAGIITQHLVKDVNPPNATEILNRADIEGGAPITIAHSDHLDGGELVCELTSIDTLPARRYLVVTTDEAAISVVLERITGEVEDSADRVQIFTLTDLSDTMTRVTLKMFLGRGCISYLGRTPRLARAPAAPITDMPIGERNIHDIDRRIMQSGMFPVPKLRVPRF